MGRQEEKRRFFLATVGAWAAENGFAVERLSGDWVVLLRRKDLVLPIISYDIGLNPSSVHRIVNDKVATHAVLAASGAPALEHRLVFSPTLAAAQGRGDEVARLRAAFDAFGGDAVVKPLDQSHGLDVVRVRDRAALDAAWRDLGSRYPRFAISPFVDIAREDRFYFLDDACLLSYGKASAGFLGNLAHGARVLFHDGREGELRDLAARARRALGLRFGCIDTMTPQSGEALVLEANSGVMLEGLARAAAAAGRTLPLAEVYRAGLDRRLAEATAGM